jgi:hypothetical protein
VGVSVRPDESVREAIDRATASGNDSADGEGEDSDGGDESDREATHIPIDGVDGDDQEGDDA